MYMPYFDALRNMKQFSEKKSHARSFTCIYGKAVTAARLLKYPAYRLSSFQIRSISKKITHTLLLNLEKGGP